jgi:hypothetical protein
MEGQSWPWSYGSLLVHMRNKSFAHLWLNSNIKKNKTKNTKKKPTKTDKQNKYDFYRLITVAITTEVVSLNSSHGKVYSIQHYMIKFVSDLWLVDGILVTSTNKTDCHCIIMFIVLSCLLCYHVYCIIMFIALSCLLCYHVYCVIMFIVLSCLLCCHNMTTQ